MFSRRCPPPGWNGWEAIASIRHRRPSHPWRELGGLAALDGGASDGSPITAGNSDMVAVREPGESGRLRRLPRARKGLGY